MIENAFGRLKNRWRILYCLFVRDLELATKIITCCVVLHNLCQREVSEPDPMHWFESAEFMRPDIPLVNFNPYKDRNEKERSKVFFDSHFNLVDAFIFEFTERKIDSC